MKRQTILLAVFALSFVTVFLVVGAGPVFALETRTEHLKADGATVIDVPGRPKFAVFAQHFKQSDFYPGSAERIQFSISGVGSKRFEDNPWRYAFSVEVGGPDPNRILVNRDTIQVLRMNDALKVYWTEPIVIQDKVIPPATLIFRADGDVLPPPPTENVPYPYSGWSSKYEVTKKYNAKVIFDCPDWGYFGPVPITDPRTPRLVTEGMMTWTHP